MTLSSNTSLERCLTFSKDYEEAVCNLYYLSNISYLHNMDIDSAITNFSRLSFVLGCESYRGWDTRTMYSELLRVCVNYNLSSQAINEVFRCICQMLVKGVVTKEELVRQLAEFLPDVLPMAALTLGITVGDFMLMLEDKDTNIYSSEFIKPFITFMLKRSMGEL